MTIEPCKRAIWLRGTAVIGAALALGACGDPETDDATGPTEEPCPTDSGTGCAPSSQRVDRYEPTFAEPTEVHNRLFPIRTLESVVLLGSEGGRSLRAETTLLPRTETIEWNGQQIETLASQYMAFTDGRLQEIAVDWYAQDDRGAVWYFGEEVFHYGADGVVTSHEGSWVVGQDGAPPAMIMPADPRVGDVYLAENVAPIAWEQVTVGAVGMTVDGPTGPIEDAIVVSELQLDGSREEKTFAPGYGEFAAGSVGNGDREMVAVAIPADATSSLLPFELRILQESSADVFEAAGASQWALAETALARVNNAWADLQLDELPPLLELEMAIAVAALEDAVVSQDAALAQSGAIEVARATFDLRLRKRGQAEIDTLRFDLWVAQTLVDAAQQDVAGVRGDSATLDAVWARVAHTFDGSRRAEIEELLLELHSAAQGADVSQAASVAEQLHAAIGLRGWRTVPLAPI